MRNEIVAYLCYGNNIELVGGVNNFSSADILNGPASAAKATKKDIFLEFK